MAWHVGKARTRCFGGLYNFYYYMAETINTDEEDLVKRIATGKNRKDMVIVLFFGGQCGANAENVAKITAFCC